MKRLLILGLGVAIVAIAVVAIVAYGGGGGGYSTGAASSATGPATVSTREIDGKGTVLVDSAGRALYAADQETAAGMVLCTDACTSFWKPLTVSKGSVTGNSATGKLGVIERPNGSRQVALDGKLLYSFVEDDPGKVTGDGFEDAFDGQTLTWHVLHADASTGSSGSSPTKTGPFGY